MQFRHLTSLDYRVMPWVNGRGQTVELLRLENETGGLELRLSVADVVEPGAFSQLPGIDRVLTLIEGEGFDLDFGGAAPGVTALPFVPVAFSGDWPTSASNLRGPSRDFNVMTAGGQYDVDVSLLPQGTSISPPVESPTLRCFYVVAGAATIGKVALKASELLVLEAADAIEIEASGSMLAVCLDPRI